MSLISSRNQFHCFICIFVIKDLKQGTGDPKSNELVTTAEMIKQYGDLQKMRMDMVTFLFTKIKKSNGFFPTKYAPEFTAYSIEDCGSNDTKHGWQIPYLTWYTKRSPYPYAFFANRHI